MAAVVSDLLTRAGYWVAAFLLSAFPAALLFWLTVHPFARFWRRRGPLVSYALVISLCLALAVGIFQFHRQLLAVRWPFQWSLAAAGLVLYAIAVWVEILCRRHLKLGTLVGGPELGESPGRLLSDGIYGRVRHPRYLSVFLGTIAWALILNYPALWALTLAVLPAGYLVILFEERELRQRFGAEYEEYMRVVPNRLVPRLGGGR